MSLDFETCYRAIASRDARFDGRFFTAVTSTGIYCRPICPAQTPQQRNVRFYPSAAAAQAAGFRACKRCRPEATPGSPDWNVRADLVGRALRLIAEGAADADGIAGLARRLAVSPRHLHRELVAEVGAGPLAHARTRRAQTARLLIDQTGLPLTTIAFAAGFASVRQFNETMRDAFGAAPGELRRRERLPTAAEGAVTLRLRYRPPLDGQALLAYFARRALPGVEEVRDGRYRRTVSLGRSTGTLELEPLAGEPYVLLRLHLDDLRDLTLLVQRCRRLLDLDVDPAAVTAVLQSDPQLAPLVASRPGLRLPGALDGWELAARAVLGQQVTLAAARTLGSRLVMALGDPLPHVHGGLTHYFPSAEAVAAATPEVLGRLGLPRTRAAALQALAAAVADGRLRLDHGVDRPAVQAQLRAVPGISEWTASYIAMRALGDPDAFPAADAGLRRAAAALGIASDPRSLTTRAEAWRPWRAYATLHLWTTLERSTDHDNDDDRDTRHTAKSAAE